MKKIVELVFPSDKARHHFEQKFSENYVFRYAVTMQDGTVKASYLKKKRQAKKFELAQKEKQLVLF